MSSSIHQIAEKYSNDASRLMDIFHDIFDELGHVGKDEIAEVATLLNLSKSDAEQTLSFYHF